MIAQNERRVRFGAGLLVMHKRDLQRAVRRRSRRILREASFGGAPLQPERQLRFRSMSSVDNHGFTGGPVAALHSTQRQSGEPIKVGCKIRKALSYAYQTKLLDGCACAHR